MHDSMLEVTCSGIPSYEQVAGTLPLAQCVWKVIPGILFLHTLDILVLLHPHWKLGRW